MVCRALWRARGRVRYLLRGRAVCALGVRNAGRPAGVGSFVDSPFHATGVLLEPRAGAGSNLTFLLLFCLNLY